MKHTIDSVRTSTAPFTQGQVPLRGADLPLLISLDMLLDECNVTRAAARMHLSQPAMSAQLSRLRQLFNDQLLVASSSGRGLIASQFAINLHRRLKPALATLHSAIQSKPSAFRPDADVRCFTIAATNMAAAIIAPALIGNSQRHGNQGLKFVFVEPDLAKLPGQLEKGEIDLCVVPACLLPAGLRVTDLVTTPHVLVQRRDHPGGTAPVTLDEYCEVLHHINVARDSTLHGYIDEQLYRKGRTRYVGTAVKDCSAVPALLKYTKLVCTLPARLVDSLDTSLVVRALSFSLSPYSLCMAWHPRAEDDCAFHWLRKELNRIAASLADAG
jgi:DNA-binding transcriptional LysR family regulator